MGIEVDLSDFFDGIRHPILLQKVARRVQDDQVRALVKKILKAGGKTGVRQGDPFSPLAAHIYLNELDWEVERGRQKTVDGPYDSLNDYRFSDDILVLVSGHQSKRWMVVRVQERLRHLQAIADRWLKVLFESTATLRHFLSQVCVSAEWLEPRRLENAAPPPNVCGRAYRHRTTSSN